MGCNLGHQLVLTVTEEIMEDNPMMFVHWYGCKGSLKQNSQGLLSFVFTKELC